MCCVFIKNAYLLPALQNYGLLDAPHQQPIPSPLRPQSRMRMFAPIEGAHPPILNSSAPAPCPCIKHTQYFLCGHCQICLFISPQKFDSVKFSTFHINHNACIPTSPSRNSKGWRAAGRPSLSPPNRISPTHPQILFPATPFIPSPLPLPFPLLQSAAVIQIVDVTCDNCRSSCVKFRQ